jgi:hypothetical protein
MKIAELAFTFIATLVAVSSSSLTLTKLKGLNVDKAHELSGFESGTLSLMVSSKMDGFAKNSSSIKIKNEQALISHENNGLVMIYDTVSASLKYPKSIGFFSVDIDLKGKACSKSLAVSENDLVLMIVPLSTTRDTISISLSRPFFGMDVHDDAQMSKWVNKLLESSNGSEKDMILIVGRFSKVAPNANEPVLAKDNKVPRFVEAGQGAFIGLSPTDDSNAVDSLIELNQEPEVDNHAGSTVLLPESLGNEEPSGTNYCRDMTFVSVGVLITWLLIISLYFIIEAITE